MLRFAVRRLISAVLVLFAVSVLTFLIFNVVPAGDPAVRMAGKVPTKPQVEAIREEWGFDDPIYVQYGTMMKKLFTGDTVSYFTQLNVVPAGDPAVRMAGKVPTKPQVEAIREEWGFDDPIYVQYGTMMKKLFTGDTVSYFTQLNVVDEIIKGAPRTFALAIGAAILSLLFGVILGVYGARHAGQWSDRAITLLAVLGLSMPVFWLGALMNHYLGFKLGVFPNGGYVEFGESPTQWLWHLMLPWIALSFLFVGFYSRVLRSDILETENEDFVRTARAKGLSEKQVMRRHVLRNSLVPIITLWGLDFGFILGGGAILTEAVFNLQGVGQYAAESIEQLDQPVIMAVTLFGAFFIVLLNAVVDIVYAALDPRIRLEDAQAP